MATGDIWVARSFSPDDWISAYFDVKCYSPAGELISERTITAGPIRPTPDPLSDLEWMLAPAILAANDTVVVFAERYIYTFDIYGNTGQYLVDPDSETVNPFFWRVSGGQFIYGFAIYADADNMWPDRVELYVSKDGFVWEKKITTGYELYLGGSVLWDVSRSTPHGYLCSMAYELYPALYPTVYRNELLLSKSYDLERFSLSGAMFIEDGIPSWGNVAIEGTKAYFASFSGVDNYNAMLAGEYNFLTYERTFKEMNPPSGFDIDGFYFLPFIDKTGTVYYLGYDNTFTYEHKFYYDPNTGMYEKQTTAYNNNEHSQVWVGQTERIFTQQAGYMALEYFGCGQSTVRVTSDKYPDFTIPYSDEIYWSGVWIEEGPVEELFWTENIKTREYLGAY